MYRAASFWTSAYAPELSMGMKTTEEIEDIIDVDYEDMTAKTVEKEIKNNANKGETIGFEDEKPEKKTQAPVSENPKVEPKETKDKNLTKLKELGYTEEDIKAMSPADEMRIIMGNVKKESKPGF
jgi:tRNA(Met) C34 N-acetyltransferase TmcA